MAIVYICFTPLPSAPSQIMECLSSQSEKVVYFLQEILLRKKYIKQFTLEICELCECLQQADKLAAYKYLGWLSVFADGMFFQCSSDYSFQPLHLEPHPVRVRLKCLHYLRRKKGD